MTRNQRFVFTLLLAASVQPALAEEGAPTAPASEAAPEEQPAAAEPAVAETAPAPEAAPAPKPSITDSVLAERPAALRGISRVAITTFSVEYMTFLEAKVEGDWSNLIGGKPNDVSVRMAGHDSAGWQAVVNAHYDRLVADLVAAGIEVVAQAEVRAQPEYAAIAKAAAELPKEVSGRAGEGTYYGAHDLPVVIQDEVAVFQPEFKFRFGGKPPEDLYMSTGSKIAASFGAGQVLNAERQLAKKLDAHILKVRLTVLPAQLELNDDFWKGGGVETTAAVSLVPFVNRYLFYAPDGTAARLSLRQDLASTRAAGQLRDVTSVASKANQVAGVAARLAGAFYGVGTPGAIGKSKDFAFEVDNSAYPEVVAETLTTAHELFLQRLIAERDAPPAD